MTKKLSALLRTSDKAELLEQRTGLKHFEFISAVERVMLRNGWNKKKLAKAVGTSPSFITQLFRGDKIVSLNMIARFEEALAMRFFIEGCSMEEHVSIMRFESTHFGKSKNSELLDLSDLSNAPTSAEQGIMVA